MYTVEKANGMKNVIHEINDGNIYMQQLITKIVAISFLEQGKGFSIISYLKKDDIMHALCLIWAVEFWVVINRPVFIFFG